MRYDIARLAEERDAPARSCASSPIPTTPTKTVRVDVPLEQSAAELGAVARPHGRAGEGHHRRQARREPRVRLRLRREARRHGDLRGGEGRSTSRGSCRGSIRAVATRTAPSPATCSASSATTATPSPASSYSRGRVPRGRGRRAQLPAQPRGLGADPRHARSSTRRPATAAPCTSRSTPTCSGWCSASPRRRCRRSAPTGRPSRSMEAKTGRLLAVADCADGRPERPGGHAPRTTAARARSRRRSSRARRSRRSPRHPSSTPARPTPLSQIIAPYRYRAAERARTSTTASATRTTPYTLTGVLIDSSNTGMSLFGERLTDQERYDDMLAFGLGERTEVGFPGEEPGDLHGGPEAVGQPDEVRHDVRPGPHDDGRADRELLPDPRPTAACGCRCGSSTAAPTATASRASRSPRGARDLARTRPTRPARCSSGCTSRAGSPTSGRSPGTGWPRRPEPAQVPDGNGGYLSGYLVSVSGFAPADDPQFVVSVSIMNPVKMNSSAASAPVFQQVMSQVLKKYRTVPSGAPAPELPATW